MHYIEPHYYWRNLYIASEDEQSPFFGREYSEFEFENQVYNYLIHPQWDDFGSSTLYVKILFADYEDSYAIIELIGEWNDAIENDMMRLKRDLLDDLHYEGLNKFILIAENVLNFHSSDDCYYEECAEDLEDGWIALINPLEHVEAEMIAIGIDQFFLMGGKFNEVEWRGDNPDMLFRKISRLVSKRLPE